MHITYNNNYSEPQVSLMSQSRNNIASMHTHLLTVYMLTKYRDVGT